MKQGNCYVCETDLFDHHPERVNPFADENEIDNELCDDCYKEAMNESHMEDMRDEEYQQYNCI